MDEVERVRFDAWLDEEGAKLMPEDLQEARAHRIEELKRETWGETPDAIVDAMEFESMLTRYG